MRDVIPDDIGRNAGSPGVIADVNSPASANDAGTWDDDVSDGALTATDAIGRLAGDPTLRQRGKALFALPFVRQRAPAFDFKHISCAGGI